MAISANLERLNYDSSDGCIATGLHREVISEAVATRSLVAEESGSLCVFDRAAGVVYTLPAPVVGMQFEFGVSVSVTSNAHKIITDSASTFLVGSVTMMTIATVAGAGFAANGTTIRALSANGTTSGGLIGERYRVTAISATQWLIEGICYGSGTIVTPFATS